MKVIVSGRQKSESLNENGVLVEKATGVQLQITDDDGSPIGNVSETSSPHYPPQRISR